jgi:preprotein translocase subunit SecG
MSEKVQWPGKAVNADGDDLSVPVRRFLVDLRLLEKKSESATLLGTPASLQVITAGATSLGKVWPALVAAVGGGSAIVTGLMGFGVGAAGTANIVQRATFTVSASLLASAVALAIAIMVRADVNARATASAAQYEARAAVTAAILSSSEFGRPVSAPPAAQPDYVLKTNNDEWLPVLGFTLNDGCLAAEVGNNRAILAQNFEALIPTNSWH